jgi:hypothetical protein
MLWLLILGTAAEVITFKEYSLDPGTTMLLDLPTLNPSTEYEIRLSFLGTIGADVQLRWACPNEVYVEKLQLKTEAKTLIGPPCASNQIELRAVRNSRGASEALDKAPIKFFVTLEAKRWGVPECVISAIASLVMLLFMTSCWMSAVKL